MALVETQWRKQREIPAAMPRRRSLEAWPDWLTMPKLAHLYEKERRRAYLPDRPAALTISDYWRRIRSVLDPEGFPPLRLHPAPGLTAIQLIDNNINIDIDI